MIESLNPYYPALLSIPKIHTDLLWLLTIMFCGLGFVYFIFVFFFRNKLSKRAFMVADKKRELAPIISQFLFFEEGSSLEERKSYLHQKVEIRELIKSKFNRSVLSEILMDLQKDVSGEARQNLYELYINLGLHQDAYDKLKSWRWEIISQGILELTQMRVEDSYLFIRRFINHSKGVIRKQAQISTVSLKHEGIAYFMDTCRYQISEWQQLKLIDVLRHLEDFTPPRFKVWLTSRNKDVVLFALRLIRYYNQNDANPAIIQLIKHRNLQIRLEAVHCLKEFGVTEALETLKLSFRRSHTDVKLSILDAIGSLGGMEEIDFLKKVERTEENFTVKSKALTAINTIDPDSIMPSEDIREPSRSDREFAEVSPEISTQANQTKLLFEQMENEKEEGEEALNLPDPEKEEQIAAVNLPEVDNEEQPEVDNEEQPEVDNEEQIEDDHLPEPEEENEIIFEICFRKELKDILDEAWQEEEPEYLSLSFLPLLESDTSNIQNEQVPLKGQDPGTGHISEEKKFRHDIDAILNKIAMTDDKNQTKNNEEIPEFLPTVVDDTTHDLETENFNELLLEMEVIAELVYGNADELFTEPTEDHIVENKFNESLFDTEVIAEIVPWQGTADITDFPGLDDANIDRGIEEDEEEHLGFSIFHEMFRDFDAESKLILLDEILVVGEEKELRFLRTLANDPDKRIRKKAFRIKELLAEKLKKTEEVPVCEDIGLADTPPVDESDLIPIHSGEAEKLETAAPIDRKIPLEYCFYHPDGNIEESTVDQDLYFELDLKGADVELDRAYSPDAEDEEAAEKSLSFLKKLFSLTDKTRDKGNG